MSALTLLFLGANAFANAPLLAAHYESSPLEAATYAKASKAEKERPEADPDDARMDIGFRARQMSVPKSVLDIWLFGDNDHSSADLDFGGRPSIEAYSVGLEFTLRSASRPVNVIFYGEYIHSTMKEGYWDDAESSDDTNYYDGDYLLPSSNLGLLTVGANYGYEVRFVKQERTNNAFGMSFIATFGLGVAYVTGHIDQWSACDKDNKEELSCVPSSSDGTRPGDTAIARYQSGVAPDSRRSIPPILPLVDIAAGLRFTLGDRFMVRVEGGLHTTLFYGISAGTTF